MRVLADASERFGFGELRVSHEQNIVLPHVKQDDLFALWRMLDAAGLATANAGLVSDIISCPGLDYCSLATARSIPIAQAISKRFSDMSAAAAHRQARHQDLGLHQRLRPSPCRRDRHSRPGEEGPGILSDHARRRSDLLRVDRRNSGTWGHRRAGAGRHRTSRRFLSRRTRGGRSLHRHLAPHRPCALQRRSASGGRRWR